MRAEALFERVDNGPLIVFRIIFGFLLFAECAGAIVTGWVRQVFLEPAFTFPILPFTWLQPLPGNGMFIYYAVMALLGLLVMAGLRFRLSLGLFTLMWTASYLMQTASYNNHYYLLILLSLLLLTTPAHADLSLDARRDPGLRRSTCPRWCLLIFVAQIAIVYFFAAVAKLNLDWLQARPVAIWFAERTDYPLIGPLYGEAWLQQFVAWGGLLFDALIVPALLWRSTRTVGLVLALLFHLFNSVTFHIGVFSYLGIGLLVFFVPPEVVRRWLLRGRTAAGVTKNYPVRKLTVALLAVFFTIQVALPLRHWLFPGDVNWTEEGHRMSWRMMTRAKRGSVYFEVRDPATGDEWRVYAWEHLSDKQVGKIGSRPAMIWQYCRFLRADYAARGIEPVEIRAISSVSLNGWPQQPLVDGRVDLASVPWRHFGPADWLLPLRRGEGAGVRSTPAPGRFR